MRVYRFWLLILGLLSLDASGKVRGLLWVQTPHFRTSFDRDTYEQKVTSRIENQSGIRVQKSPYPIKLTKSVVKKEKLFKELLTHLSLGKPDDIKLSHWIESVRRKLKSFPGQLFGPEIEKVEIFLVLESWKQGDFELARRILREVIKRSPFQYSDFIEGEAFSSWEHILEAETNQIQKDEGKALFCPIDSDNIKKGSVWINGHLLTEKDKLLRQGLFLIIHKKTDGSLTERVFRCEGQKLRITALGMAPLRQSPRIEMLLPFEWQELSEVLILEKDNEGVKEWVYSRLDEYSSFLNRKEGWNYQTTQDLLVDKPLTLETLAPVNQKKKWYNKGVLRVIGGVVGLGLIIYGLQQRSESRLTVPISIQ